jgi:hypothetical protein
MALLNRVRYAARPALLAGALRRELLQTERSRGIYPALAELAGRYRAAGSEPPDLTAHELRVFSQNGEDGVLAELLRRTGTAPGFFVEFGAEDGSEGNTVFLATVLGWAGVYLEADAAAFAALEHRHRGNTRVRTMRAAVTAENVDALLAEAGVPEEPDVLSIDVDGNDYWIWRALRRHRPRIVVIEYNGALDPRSERVMPYDPGFRWDRTAGYGASLGALERLAGEKGYRLAHTESAGVNAFFVREDLARDLPPLAAVPRRTVNLALMGIEHPPPRREPEWQAPA